MNRRSITTTSTEPMLSISSEFGSGNDVTWIFVVEVMRLSSRFVPLFNVKKFDPLS